jgi:hypothetical protein
MNSIQNNKPNDGVSPAIKLIVVGLTILTVIAFSVFFYKLVSKVTSSDKERPWALELQVVGDKLKKVGLHKQAADLYARFLDNENIDLKTRAVVSQTLGELYTELGDCHSALVWLYQAEVAGPEPADKETLAAQIAICLKKVKSEQP